MEWAAVASDVVRVVTSFARKADVGAFDESLDVFVGHLEFRFGPAQQARSEACRWGL